MQDHFSPVVGPMSIDAAITRAREERAQALTALLHRLPAAIGRFIAKIRLPRQSVKPAGRWA